MSELKPICPPERCTGCMACINSCSHSAITLVENDLGFIYPQIDNSKCIDCKLCYQVCPELHPRPKTMPTECYAAALNNVDELMTCASGGAATAFSIEVLRRGGIVVGCSGKDMHNVSHVIVEKEEDLEQLKGSKYVQSAISDDLFRKIRKELLGGREVLFIGTGCQCAGLKNFLRREYDNLITVDLVCHGVPSQKMLNENMVNYPGIEPNSVRFREKIAESDGEAIRYGWSMTSRIGSSAKPIFVKWYKDPYLAAFMECLTFRECCYACQYACPLRQTDITICDFWGLKRDSSLTSRPGVSAILINTKKGRRILNDSSEMLDLESRPVNEAIRGNGQLLHPSEDTPARKLFVERYKKDGFAVAALSAATPNIRKKRFRRQIFCIAYKILGPIYRPLKSFFKR